MAIAVVFPGQGSQYVGMGKDFYEEYKEVRELFSLTDEALEFSLTDIIFGEDEEKLKLTYHTQPALLLLSYAIWEVTKSRISPSYMAGHSLGEYSALTAAGGFNIRDAILAVYHRGCFMQEAVPVGVGSMAAILGADDELVLSVCNEISSQDHVVEVANLNSPGQVVVSGHTKAVGEFCSKIKEKGAKRTISLPVSAPFHSSLMEPAKAKMANYLNDTTINNLSLPVFNNVDALSVDKSSEVLDALIRQMTGSVKWTLSVQNMIKAGCDTFIELGAGTVLSGLIKKIDKNVKCINISKVEDLAKLDAI